MMEFQCEQCGKALGYQGLCWKCKTQKKRRKILGLSPEKIEEKIKGMIEHAEHLEDYTQQEYQDFWDLLQCHGICSPEVAKAALRAEVWYPVELYFHAPAEVRDGLIQALHSAEDSGTADHLLSCLAMQGDDVALNTLLELEKSPLPWRENLYVDPSVYAQCGGWSFDKEGNRIVLNYSKCYPMVKGEGAKDSAAMIGRIREDRCPHCGCRMVDMLVLDGRDPRLSFLGVEGIITATCCPNCVGYQEAAFSRFTLDGGSQPMPAETGMEQDYIGDSLEELAGNSFVLGENPVSLFYSADSEDVNTIGGFANWVQDWVYTACPDCGKIMRYVGQIHWDTVMEYMEGTLYIEICPDCHIASMQHQQT